MIGVIYFGKRQKEQSEKSKTQVFVDIDDEQLRFDKSDKHPKEVLCKLTAEFKDTKINQEFNN